jgi:hypothetical protein
MTAGGFMATDRATGDDMATHTGQLECQSHHQLRRIDLWGERCGWKFLFD